MVDLAESAVHTRRRLILSQTCSMLVRSGRCLKVDCCTTATVLQNVKASLSVSAYHLGTHFIAWQSRNTLEQCPWGKFASSQGLLDRRIVTWSLGLDRLAGFVW